MKYFIGIMISSLLVVAGCSNDTDKVEQNEKIEKTEAVEKTGSVEVKEPVEKIETKEKSTMKSQPGDLIKAVENNDVTSVREVLEDQSYSIDETNKKGETPLLIAVHGNHPIMSKLLIDAGADINKQDTISDSPYLFAGAEGRAEILQYMIENAKPNQKIVNRYGGNTLIPAAEKGHLNNVKILLADGSVDINHQNNFGYTALIEAVALNDGSKVYQQIVQELVDHHADKALRDQSGKTALDYAQEKGFTKIIAILEK
ncbi:ankyrin repeat domain-containing protein [Kurthia sibirica]|uniref:Uncharacterized protein n=1 Tax=Kurthia sibirica TaxID=202750 RepID=A0A2U3AQA0_9BACL|nr:ankyrin repeat domain-containing protein [Kurthia sibirica]PWI26635.1 hypothetical protein DEX24_02405 [Kurthia sibirica]GEK32892.1 hypothetical protein KSI01_04250 [Kurthia sibirica]